MPTPNTNVPIADPQTGRVMGEWLNFFQTLTAPAAAARPITATNSPFTYKAPSAGALVLSGPVDSITLIRGRDPVALPPTPGLIPMAAGDQLLVGYTDAPGMTFLPS